MRAVEVQRRRPAWELLKKRLEEKSGMIEDARHATVSWRTSSKSKKESKRDSNPCAYQTAQPAPPQNQMTWEELGNDIPSADAQLMKVQAKLQVVDVVQALKEDPEALISVGVSKLTLMMLRRLLLNAY